MKVADLQDRVKYCDEKEFDDTLVSRNIQVELNNIQTRTRTILAVSSAYQKLIDVMLRVNSLTKNLKVEF